MFVTLHTAIHIILKNIIKGSYTEFSQFFFLFIVFSNPVYGSEATGEKAEFNYFPIFFFRYPVFQVQAPGGLLFGGAI